MFVTDTKNRTAPAPDGAECGNPPVIDLSRATVLVTDAGRGSAVSIIRSLGRRGCRVIAADPDPGSAGFRSRYTAAGVVYPAPETDASGCAEALYRAVCEYGVDLLIPVTDLVILPLSQQRARFRAACRLALPEAEALAVTSDKQRTLELAERLGVPAPRSCPVHTVQEAMDCADDLTWPVVLKPQASRQRGVQGVESFTVCYAENREMLAECMRRFEGRCAVLLQEYTQGTGHGVELLLHEGRPLAAFQHQRLREVPVSGGASAFRQSVPLDPAMLDYACRLMSTLCWTGLAMVEFKVGPDGPKLMEINGRVWGSLPLAVRSGMDFPARLAELYLAGAPHADTPLETGYRAGVRARNLRLELSWMAQVLTGRRRYPFLSYPPRHAAFGALAQLLDPRCKYDLQCLEDPRPGLAELCQLAGSFRRARA